MFNPIQPKIQVVNANLFPTMDSLDAVINYCKSQLSVEDSHKVIAVLMTYHNTLINQFTK